MDAIAVWLCLYKSQGSKNLFCASRRIFLAGHRRHFSGRIFFQLGRNGAPSLKKLGAKKKKSLSLRAAFAHTRTRTSSMTWKQVFFFCNGNRRKERKKRSCAQFMLMKSKEVNRVGVVGIRKADKKSASKGKEKINAPTRVNRLYRANCHYLNTFSSFFHVLHTYACNSSFTTGSSNFDHHNARCWYCTKWMLVDNVKF